MSNHPIENPGREAPLDSWKEIAAYLQRDVSTAMRWEKSEGLPVRRHHHGSRASVYAYPSELDAWKATREPPADSFHPWTRWVPALAGGLTLLVVAALIQWGPILNPPHPLVEAAKPEDGVSLRQVWAGTDVDVMGSVSRDGRYLSFVNWSTGDLGLRDLVNAESRNLTNKGTWEESDEFAEFSVISPDGRQVAYAWYNDDFYDLRLIGIEGITGGREPRVVYSNPELHYIVPIDFFPDGKRILTLFQRKDRTFQIVILGIEDQSVNVLKSFDWRWPETALSPDGRHILYHFPAGEGEAPRDIFLLAADGSSEVPLVSHPANDEVLGWAPDGSSVLFASDRGGQRGAWLLPLDDRKGRKAPRIVKSQLDAVMALGFSRDGAFYYSVRTGMQDIYTAALDFEAGRLLTAPERVTQRFVGTNSSPAWSPDGKYLAYISRRKQQGSGSQTIVIRTIDTGHERDIHPRIGYFGHARWSPDGRSLYFTGRDERNRRVVFQIDVETEELTTVVGPEPDVYYFSVRLSPNGETLYYSAVGPSDQVAIRARDLKTGAERKIYRGTQLAPEFDLSPDGHWIAALQPQRDARSIALNVMPSDGGAPRELLRLRHPEGMGRHPIWTADSRHILFWKRRDVRSDSRDGELWSQPIDGGPPRRIGLSAEHPLYMPKSVHPDGRQIAFTAGKDRREIWAMENFLPEPGAAK